MSSDSPSPESNRPQGFPAAPGHLDRALTVVEFLRQHCAWDREQTPTSLVRHLLEEAHETVEAILKDGDEELEGELGDLLLNLAFQVVLAEERGAFDREGVIRRLEAKMVRRHPHLFGLGEAEPWAVLKAREAVESGAGGGGRLEGVAAGLPPLMKAQRLQEEAAEVGFDWDSVEGALAKVREEMLEVEEALAEGSEEAIRGEIGDLLFSVVNVARLAGVHAGAALEITNVKFRRRFSGVERLARERGIAMPGASLDVLDALWDEVKGVEMDGKG